MSKSALITGGAGFIGFHLARHLFNQNYNVTILDNFSRGEEDKEFEDLISKENVRFIRGNVINPQTFNQLAGDFDYVYHLAAINGTENFYSRPDEVLKVNVLGTLNILDWFIKQRGGKLLFTSSSETYAGALKLMGDNFPLPTPEEVPLVVDNPTNVRWSYGASKILGEVAIHAYAKSFGMRNFSIIRYHNIYGPRMGDEHVMPQFIKRIVVGEDPFKILGGLETRTFCYVDDETRATQMVMESDETNGKTIHIGRSDGEIRITDLAEKLFDIAEVNPKLELLPAPEGSVIRRCPDTTKLQNLGFKAEVSLEEGLKKTYEWYKNKF